MNPEKEEPLSTQIDHAKAALQSVQERIQFMDAKAGGIIAVVTALAGVFVYFVQTQEASIGTSEVDAASMTCLGVTRLLLGLAFIGAAAWAIICCALATIGRRRLTSGSVILFPVHEANPEEMDAKRDEIMGQLRQLDLPMILHEYADQLTNNGFILKLKMKYVKWASYAILVQAAVAAILATLILVSSFLNASI